MTLASASPLMQQVGWLLVHSVWEFAAIGLVLAIALRALRGASAGTRYVLALVGWCAMLVAPVVTWFALPTPDVVGQVAPEMERTATADTDTAPVFEPEQAVEFGLSGGDAFRLEKMALRAAAVPVAAVQPVVPWTESLRVLIAPWLNTLVVIWCTGVSAFAARSARGWYVVRRLLHRDVTGVSPERAKRCSPAWLREIGLRGPVRLLQSSRVDVPLVIGWLQPVVLLPVCVATGFSPQQLEAILAHSWRTSAGMIT
ncbi:MAG: M56 family metallopeptidase [Planctomycetaceae bacterium]